MKTTRQRLMNEKRSDTLEQIKKKNEISMKLIDKTKSDKMYKRQLKMNNTLQSEERIKNKMKNHFEKLEEDRLEIERLIETRSKKNLRKKSKNYFIMFILNNIIKPFILYFILFYSILFKVTLYNQNNQEHLNSIRLKFGQRLQDSLDCYHKNLELVKEKLAEKKNEDEQKTIDKLEKWVK